MAHLHLGLLTKRVSYQNPWLLKAIDTCLTFYSESRLFIELRKEAKSLLSTFTPTQDAPTKFLGRYSNN